jgi:peptide/nickel transport system substrate-binding protein
MQRGNGSRVLVPACVVVALLAIGCGGGHGGGGTTATTGSGARGNLLTIANPSFPATLDPAKGDNVSSDYNNLVYDPLIVLGPDGKFHPGLALSWKYGPRNLSFSMKLRPNVRFSDGEPFDASAVKTWIEHVRTLPGGAGGGYLRDLRSVEVSGPLSLTVHFKEPTPLLERVFSQALQVGMPGSPRAVKAGTLKTNPVGAGQYVLDRAQTVVRDHYTYVPNPKYWNQGAIHWKKVVIKTISNPSAALQALKTGQVQVVKDQPVTTLNTAKQAGLGFVAPTTLLMGLQFSDRDGRLLKPLGDVRVRQAINYAIDRRAIAGVLGAGYGEVVDQMAAKGDDAYDPALQGRYPYDPEQAKRLLAQAGYAKGFTLPVLSVNVVGQDTLAEAIAGQLAKVGITVKPDIKTNVGDYGAALASTKYPAVTTSWGRLPAVTNYQLLWGPSATGSNPFKNRDARIDALYAELTAAPPQEADAVARRMTKVLVDEGWFAPVVATPLVVLYAKSVAGVNATAERNVTYTNEFRPAG